MPCDAPGVGVVAFAHVIEGAGTGIITQMMSQVHVVKNSSSSSSSSSSSMACGSSASDASAALRAVLSPILSRPSPSVLLITCDRNSHSSSEAAGQGDDGAFADASYALPAVEFLANSSNVQTLPFCSRNPLRPPHASLSSLAAAAATAAAQHDDAKKFDSIVFDVAGGDAAAAAAVLAWELLRVDGVLLMVPRDVASVKVHTNAACLSLLLLLPS